MKKNSSEDLQALLAERKQKNDPAYIKKFFLQAPEKKWSCHKSDSMISYKLNHEINNKSLGKARQWLRNHPEFDLGNGLQTQSDVIQNEKVSRFDFSNKGLLRGDVAYIINENDDVLHLDRKIKCYLHLENKVLPKFTFQDKAKTTVEVIGTEKLKDRTVTHVIVTANGPENVKYDLLWWNDDSIKPFIDNVCKAVLGCDDKLSEAGVSLKSLRQYGIPIQGKLYYLDARNAWINATEFNLSDIKVEKAKESVFAVPDGYGDLKDYVKTFKEKPQGKRITPGPSVRISDAINPSFSYRGYAGRNNGDEDNTGDQSNQDYRSLARTNELQFPECFPSTFASLIANDVDEKVPDDLKWIINAVTKRLQGFGGNNGNIDIDWLNQFSVASAALAPGAGSGLFEIIRDPANHLGLLDKMAIKSVQQLLVDGTVTTTLNFAGNPALLAVVTTALTFPPAARWDNIDSGSQFSLVELYVEQRLAHLKFTYPSSVGWQTVFHGLVEYRIYDIKFNIAIDNKPVITTLEFDNDSIHLVINLDDVTGQAFLETGATSKYWWLTGLSWVGCFFMPLLCILSSALTAVGIFLETNIDFVSVDLSDIVIDSHIRFIPNGAGVLQPDVTLTLNANVNVSFTSVIPDGIHQILAFIIQTVANSSNLVLNTLQSQLQDKLNDYVKNDLKLTYPPSFGPVPLSGLSSAVAFTAMDNLFLEAGLNAGLVGITSPFITQVESDVKDNLLKLRNDFKAAFTDPVVAFNATNTLAWASKSDFRDIARFYLGSVISQNFLNHYVYTLWRNQDFNYDFTPSQAADVFHLIQPYFPQFKHINPKNVMAHLWPATSPRTVLTPYPATKGEYYATTFFDDIRLCLEFRGLKEDNRIEFLFAAQAFTELGFGGRVPGKTLDILKVTDRVFDIYFDTTKFIIKTIHPEIDSFRLQSIVIGLNVNYSPLLHLDPAFELACQYAFENRTSTQIPRDPVDPTTIQRYPIGFDTYTPDGAFIGVFQLTPFRGNIYVNTGLSGKGTAIMQGSNLDIDTMDQTTADILRAFI